MVKPFEERKRDREERTRIATLLSEYLEFRTHLNFSLDSADGETVRYEYKHAGGYWQEENEKDYKAISRAYRELYSYAGPRSRSGDATHAFFEIPSSVLSALKLEKDILSDQEFLTWREAKKTNTINGLPTDHEKYAPLVMESVGDADVQAKTATGMAEQIHQHISAIHALRTQATTLGLTPEVDKLVAQLNASARSR